MLKKLFLLGSFISLLLSDKKSYCLDCGCFLRQKKAHEQQPDASDESIETVIRKFREAEHTATMCRAEIESGNQCKENIRLLQQVHARQEGFVSSLVYHAQGLDDNNYRIFMQGLFPRILYEGDQAAQEKILRKQLPFPQTVIKLIQDHLWQPIYDVCEISKKKDFIDYVSIGKNSEHYVVDRSYVFWLLGKKNIRSLRIVGQKELNEFAAECECKSKNSKKRRGKSDDKFLFMVPVLD